jgi:hypothetical protein
LGASPGSAEQISERGGNSGAASFELAEFGHDRVARFDSYGLRPDVVKIDVEGMELDVLSGMSETLAACLPTIAIESHSEMMKVTDFLGPHGYRRIGASWAASPTYIFVARRRHRWRSLLLVHAIIGQYIQAMARSGWLSPARGPYKKLRKFPRLVLQRLRGHARRVVRATALNVPLKSHTSSASVVPEERSLRARKSVHYPRIVVSLTSFPARIESAWVAIESIFDQSRAPDDVVLCLSIEEFPNKNLPKSVGYYLRNGLQILWVKDDTRSYKKLSPARTRFPDAVIVTADDDNVYDANWLGSLYEASLSNPEAVVGHRGHEVAWTSYGIAPYDTWLSANRKTPSTDVFLTGVGGVLYPPRLPSEDLLRDLVTPLSVCPNSDDIWFWAANRLHNVEQLCIGEFKLSQVHQIRSAPNLYEVNVSAGQNDFQLSSAIQHFGLRNLSPVSTGHC